MALALIGESTTSPSFELHDYGTINLTFECSTGTDATFHFSSDNEAWTVAGTKG
jgi:hypothetical protein